jgi:hypothetical protein
LPRFLAIQGEEKNIMPATQGVAPAVEPQRDDGTVLVVSIYWEDGASAGQPIRCTLEEFERGLWRTHRIAVEYA